MSTIIAGVVTNGLVVPSLPLKEGSFVQIHLIDEKEILVSPARRLTIKEIRRLPPEEREKILAAAAELAEDDYLNDKELTGFVAFSEELDDEDE